ncbi:cellulose binding domain-containing protein [Streptomyces sp. NPDC044780]|uniref:cellulose binding domain-containing protein n=1 Tax=unclassified Streptomyces TaxID=2593676 RepID=UPI0034086BF6
MAEALGWTGDGGGDPGPATGCAVTYAVTSQWNTGFTANVTVKNTGTDATSGWRVAWSYPSGQQVTSAWNATVTRTGSQVTAANAYNGTIGAGASVSFGLNGSWAGANTAPGAFTLNGTACTTG